MTQTPLAQEFNRSAAAAREAFPERLDKLVVLVTSLKKPLYVSPDIAAHLKKNVAAVKEEINFVICYMQLNNYLAIANKECYLAGETVQRIAINEGADRAFSSRYTKEMDNIATFDHEMGHLVVKNGFSPDRNLAECAADAYAALRHIQRFGMRTGFFEYSSRASYVVFGDSPQHYTDAAIQKVKRLSKEMDVSSLSLRKTAKLAGEIALECKLNAITLGKIVIAFTSVTDACEMGADAICKKTLSVMERHSNDPDIFEAGKRFLRNPFRKKIIAKLAKNNPYWRKVLDFLAKDGKAVLPALPKNGLKP